MPEDEPGSTEHPQLSDSWIRRLTRRIGEIKKLLLEVGGVVVAIGAIVTGVLAITGHIGTDPNTKSTATPQPTPDGGPLPTTVVSPSHAPSATTSALPSPTQPLNISVVCKLPPAVHKGEQTTATYVITSNQAVKVGIGAGVYDSGGTDHSNGDGDMDGYQLKAGTQSVTRKLILPSSLQADQYEIDAEIWPSGEIGANGANTLAEATCGYFNVS